MTREERSHKNFAEYDMANPVVYLLTVRFTLEQIRKGFKHYAIQAVLERVRWEISMPTVNDPNSGFKINNDYFSYYARKFHRDFPLHDGFFRLRASYADSYFAPGPGGGPSPEDLLTG